MVYTLYLWKPRLLRDEVGHLALELPDGTYISHWPVSDAKLFGSKRSAKHTYADDVRLEGRKHDDVLYLFTCMLDENAIKRWWRRHDKDYNVLFNNCAQVVYEALEQGGIQEYAKFTTFFKIRETMLTPKDVFNFARECDSYYDNGLVGGAVKNTLTSLTFGLWKEN